MNNKALTLSLLMAVLAIFFVQSYVSSIEDEARKKFGTEVLVLKAKRDIKEMETFNETLVELDHVPKKFLEPAAVSFSVKDEDKANDQIRKLAGSVAIVPIKKGEQVTYNKLTEPSMRTGLAPQIAPGRRAISVAITDTNGVSKLLKPGDRVDLIAVLDLGGGGGGKNKLAKTILQDVVILATGKAVTNNIARTVEQDPYGGPPKVKSLTEDTNYPTITLEVEPAQAQMMALLVASGDNALSISLRNNDDTDRVNLPGVTTGDILGPDAARAPAGKR
jgi:pilus assembly protein CpaB